MCLYCTKVIPATDLQPSYPSYRFSLTPLGYLWPPGWFLEPGKSHEAKPPRATLPWDTQKTPHLDSVVGVRPAGDYRWLALRQTVATVCKGGTYIHTLASIIQIKNNVTMSMSEFHDFSAYDIFGVVATEPSDISNHSSQAVASPQVHSRGSQVREGGVPPLFHF